MALERKTPAPSSKKVRSNPLAKENLFTKIPQLVTCHSILNFLDTKNVIAVAQTSKDGKTVTQEKLDLKKLLLYVAQGKQDEAEELIKQNPQLLFKKDIVTDFSKRTFISITAFQYALWALDRHMWVMILKYLPEENAAYQLNELEEDGVSYRIGLDPKNIDPLKLITERHYDFASIIDPYQACNELTRIKSHSQAEKIWIEGVGGAQRFVPAHVANEYCRNDISFTNKADFKDNKISRTLLIDKSGHKKSEPRESTFFPMLPNLGSKFAIAKYKSGIPYTLNTNPLNDLAAGGLAALINLRNARTEEYKELKLKLANVSVPNKDLRLS